MGPTASFYWLLGPRAGSQRSSGQWQNRVGLVNFRQNISISKPLALRNNTARRNRFTCATLIPTPTHTPHNHHGSPVKVQRPLGPVPPYRALRARPDPDPPGSHLRGSSLRGAPGRRSLGAGGLAGPRAHGPDGQHRCVRLVPPSPPPTAPPRLPATKHSRT
jgi:hypothetical protein